MTELQHTIVVPAADIVGIVRETVRASLSSRLLIVCDGHLHDEDPSASALSPERFEQWLDLAGRAVLARLAAVTRQNAATGLASHQPVFKPARCAQCGGLATCITVGSSGIEWPACDSHAAAQRRSLE